MQIKILKPEDNSDVFMRLLDKPSWFIDRFQKDFDDHRSKTKGEIILINDNNSVLGGTYIEVNQDYTWKKLRLPTFGWFKTENNGASEELLKEIKRWASKKKFSWLRGPINVPKTFGGWGEMVKSERFDPLINVPWAKDDSKGFLNQTDYVEKTQYFNTKMNYKKLDF